MQQYFTNVSPRARDIKERINKWDFIKLETSARLKETLAKWIGNQLYGKNIFTNDTSDKGLLSKIYKDMIPHQEDKQSIKKSN